jgi:hypothetical protein
MGLQDWAPPSLLLLLLLLLLQNAGNGTCLSLPGCRVHPLDPTTGLVRDSAIYVMRHSVRQQTGRCHKTPDIDRYSTPHSAPSQKEYKWHFSLENKYLDKRPYLNFLLEKDS